MTDSKPNQIFRICDSMCATHITFQLFKYVILAYSLDLKNVTAYFKYVNTVVIVYFN